MDLFGLRHTDGTTTLLDFLLKNYPFRVYKEQIAKLLNACASEMVGRDYFLNAQVDFIRKVADAFYSETRDTIFRQNLLGTLEKLSVRYVVQKAAKYLNSLYARRRVQSALIKMEFIPNILKLLNDHADGLSAESAEYAIALFMNLCLRSAGKKICCEYAQRTLNVLTGLLDLDNLQVKSYVHASLYALMSEKEMREAAKATGLGDLLAMHKDTADEVVLSQMDYIVERINSEDATSLSDEVSEDGDDVDDVDEVVGPISFTDETMIAARMRIYRILRTRMKSLRFRKMNSPVKPIWLSISENCHRLKKHQLPKSSLQRRRPPLKRSPKRM
jgi:hypothetical protein